jgi:hypothetical protein
MKNDDKVSVVYHYHRGNDLLATPNKQIAMTRGNTEKPIQVETITNGESEWSEFYVE